MFHILIGMASVNEGQVDGWQLQLVIGGKKLITPHLEMSDYFTYLKAPKMALNPMRIAPVVLSSDCFERPILQKRIGRIR